MFAKMHYLGALTALLACVAPAHADWEGTHWGMAPDAALAALEGARSHAPTAADLYEYDGKQFSPLVKLPYALDGIGGQAALLFDADQSLQFVTFTPDDLTQCDALAAALGERHGASEESGFGSTAILNWIDGDDVIRLTNSTAIGICALSYGPA